MWATKEGGKECLVSCTRVRGLEAQHPQQTRNKNLQVILGFEQASALDCTQISQVMLYVRRV